MVSKRKPNTDADNEPGPSTKRPKIQEKIKTKQENLVVEPKKKRKRDKIIKEKSVEIREEIIKPDMELSATKTDRMIPNYGSFINLIFIIICLSAVFVWIRIMCVLIHRRFASYSLASSVFYCCGELNENN